ncbi:26254_t:CDS:2, partial [Gigaspora margarita]
MVNEKNVYLVENKKAQVEEVREINNKMPSYEEFMKTYENDGNLSYDDLSSGDVGEVKGYGPCSWDNPNCSCYDNNRNFQLRVCATSVVEGCMQSYGYVDFRLYTSVGARIIAQSLRNILNHSLGEGWEKIAAGLEEMADKYDRGERVRNTLEVK